MAVDQANARGGVKIGDQRYLLALDKVDEPLCAEPAGGSPARDLVQHGVVAVIGHFCSNQSMLAQPIYEQAGIPMISPTSTSPALTAAGGHSNFFRIIARDGAPASLLAAYFHDRLHLKNSLIVVRTPAGGPLPNDTNLVESNAYHQAFESLGGQVVDVLTSATDQAVASYLSTAGAVDAVAYFDGEAGDDGFAARAATLRQAVAGVNPYLTFGWSTGSASSWALGSPDGTNPLLDAYVAAVGPAAREDYVAVASPNFSALPHWKEFYDAYLGTGAAPLSGDSALATAFYYDATGLLIDAIQRAGSIDPIAIRDAIAATRNYEGVIGKYERFDSAGDAVPQWAWLERFQAAGRWHEIAAKDQ